MKKMKSSPDSQALRSALKQAKNGAFDEAQKIAAQVTSESLSTDDLRVLALIHSYCGKEGEAEQVLKNICARPDVGLGDCYMLATTQIGLGQAEQAIGNLRREIATSDSRGDVSYLSVSVINLAFLLAKNGSKADAREVLGRIADSEGTYIHGVGQMTKRDLLSKLG